MKRGLSENKLSKNKTNLLKKIKYTPKTKINNNNNINNDNKDNINNKVNNEVPLYNIDLFTGVKEEFEKDKNNKKNNNIYLNFYNKYTKNQVLPKENKISKRFFDNNIELIKEKQEKYKLRKEEEEKIKKQKEREDTNEYRKEQMAKLYKMENVYKREILKRKNKTNLPRSCQKITIMAKDKEKNERNEKKESDGKNEKKESDGNVIKLSRKEYDKKLDYFNKQTRIYLNELEKMPVANKTMKVYERERHLNKLINDLQGNIFKYQNHIGIEIVDD